MAKYQYNFTNQNRNSGRRDPNNGGRSDTGYWIVTAIMLFALTPIGILMLVLKLLDGEKPRGQRGRHPNDVRQGQTEYGAYTTTQTYATSEQAAAPKYTAARGPEQTAQQKKKKGGATDKKIGDGQGLILAGVITTAISAFMTLVTLGEFMHMRYFEFDSMLACLSFVGAGVGLMGAGLRRRKKGRRYRNLLHMIGMRETVSIESLAQATGQPISTVCKDLEAMLEDSLLPAGYIDYGRNMLVLSGEGIYDAPPREEKQAEPPVQESEENAVLIEIRAVNDAIDNPKLSAQIDRIGVITAKIFDFQKKHPDKSPQLHSFLSYYLPTTLKILRAYAQLEDQEVEGANINASMARIEDMMDKVVEGFEKQLDQLFQNEALNIATDIQVLEQMMAKDGLSGGMMQMEL